MPPLWILDPEWTGWRIILLLDANGLKRDEVSRYKKKRKRSYFPQKMHSLSWSCMKIIGSIILLLTLDICHLPFLQRKKISAISFRNISEQSTIWSSLCGLFMISISRMICLLWFVMHKYKKGVLHFRDIEKKIEFSWKIHKLATRNIYFIKFHSSLCLPR